MTDTQTSERGQQIPDTHSKSAPSLVTRAWDDSDGTTEDASDILFNYATRDRDFIAAKLPEIVKSWARDQIGGHVGRMRLASWTPPNMDATGKGARFRAAFSQSIMDFPLPGGQRLGDATPDDVKKGAQFYEVNASDMAHKSRWLYAVASAAGDASRIQDALTEAELRALQETTNVT